MGVEPRVYDDDDDDGKYVVPGTFLSLPSIHLQLLVP